MIAEGLLGLRFEAIDWEQVGLGEPPIVEKIEGQFYLEVPSKGLSLVADDGAVVHTVQMHAAGHEGYSVFAGALPGGLEFSFGRLASRQLLGAPVASGEPTNIHPFGRTNAWDRWSPSSGPIIHAQYASDEESIEMLSIMLAPPD